MALLDYVTEEDASGAARDYYERRSGQSGSPGRYDDIRDEKGRSLYNELRLNNPEVVAAQDEYSRRLLRSGIVDENLYEIVMVAVAQANECDYCAGSHRENLDLLLEMDEKVIASVAEGNFDSLPERERIVAEFASRCIEDPHRVSEADIDGLRDVGFDDADVIQLLALVGQCNTANLFVDALNAHPADLDREFRY